MGDIQMYNFRVVSKIHNYSVEFINNFEETLKKELVEGDFLIIDNKIIKLYSEKLDSYLSNYQYVGIEATETQKSYQGLIPIIKRLIEKGFTKNCRLVAIGGGITQDVTAFISSIIYRGVKWLYFPTTLLAQGDSCIGSKTSINFEGYKNQMGGFYPPSKIFIYKDFLLSLSQSDIKSGMGEMLHYFIVAGENDFNYFKGLYQKAFTDNIIRSNIIEHSLEIKKTYIEKDEFDQNIRQVFNYGHSFGHAIESLTNYKIPHGIAVSFGMDMANYISVKMGLLDHSVRDEIRQITKYIWEGYSLSGIDIHAFINALSKDKKNVGNQLGLILNKGYGKIYKQLVTVDKNFIGWVQAYFDTELEVGAGI